MRQDFMFTSESVTEGHPDKLCDQVSDALVDHFLEQDPFSLIRMECAVSTGILFIAARFNSDAIVDIAKIARQVIRQMGYDREDFNPGTCSIMTSLNEMPAGPTAVVDESELSEDEIEAVPASNQVTVFGFACTQTSALMPLPIWLAHKLARQLAAVRLKGLLEYSGAGRQDSGGHGVPRAQALAHPQHHPRRQPVRRGRPLADQAPGRPDRVGGEARFRRRRVTPGCQHAPIRKPRGPLLVGGPTVHSGLTGRKNAIDTYGEYSRHSGAALSGKDPTRIDRVGAYAARHAAKNIVAAGLAQECELQLSYTVGLSRPVSIQVETFGTGRVPDGEIGALVERNFDLRPAGIVRTFNLRRLPAAFKGRFYSRLATYGHMGRMDIGLPWEMTDRVGRLG